ncbi:MAG TPA: class A beta-lactamase [Ramlibacter sp.]|jgi:beta-lactamase class A|nr:class A beta-lactamase [Ramlibacter sp.]
MKRRECIAAGGAALVAWPCVARSDAARQATFDREVRRIENASGGRLGVALRDSATGAGYAWRADERFPLTSTFKMLLAAQVLAAVDRGTEHLARRIAIQASDLVPYAPATQPRVGGEPMTLAELCEAAVALSDNVAANVLLAGFGGPAGLTAWLRTLGDTVTRLDRIEPQLNEAVPGDVRDTTTPAAMLRTMDRLVLGDALSPASRRQLTDWLLANKVGATRLRAQLPAGWRIADKTGAGANGTNNDVGVLWPPQRGPLLVAAYLTGSTADGPGRDRALAEVGRLAATLFTP